MARLAMIYADVNMTLFNASTVPLSAEIAMALILVWFVHLETGMPNKVTSYDILIMTDYIFCGRFCNLIPGSLEVGMKISICFTPFPNFKVLKNTTNHRVIEHDCFNSSKRIGIQIWRWETQNQGSKGLGSDVHWPIFFGYVVGYITNMKHLVLLGYIIILEISGVDRMNMSNKLFEPH